MFKLFKKKNAQPPASGPEGERAYVIGDIHGCYDAMIELLKKIDAVDADKPKAQTSLIFLGDLIDRGPASKEVVEFLSKLSDASGSSVFLMGNHEEVLLDIVNGNADMVGPWFEFGGRSCARSYGVTDLGQVNIDPYPLAQQISQKVPQHHVDFIASFKDYHLFGDFLCVHAGIRPKQALDKQSSKDMRWIREPFLSYTKDHPYVVVHGHTVIETATDHGNRIAIDTGAGKDGTLTALCIDGTDRSFISVDVASQT